jgi:hypothetical protein
MFGLIFGWQPHLYWAPLISRLSFRLHAAAQYTVRDCPLTPKAVIDVQARNDFADEDLTPSARAVFDSLVVRHAIQYSLIPPTQPNL